MSGRVFEAISAFWERRLRADFYHAALVICAPEGRYTVEMVPIPDGFGTERRVGPMMKTRAVTTTVTCLFLLQTCLLPSESSAAKSATAFSNVAVSSLSCQGAGIDIELCVVRQSRRSHLRGLHASVVLHSIWSPPKAKLCKAQITALLSALRKMPAFKGRGG